MAEQPLEQLIQSIGRSLSQANRELGRGDGRRQYAVSELTVSAPLSGLTVDEDVLVDTELEDEDPGNRYIEFTVVPLPAEEETETPPEREMPDVEDRPAVRAVETLMEQGFSTDRIRFTFDPDADAAPGTVTSYQVSRSAGPRDSEAVLTVAGEPPEENTLGAIGSSSRADGEHAYRRRESADVWHFCRNCSNYPEEDFVTSEERPTSGEFCNECLAKDERDNCE